MAGDVDPVLVSVGPQLWAEVARRMARHVDAGRGHLLTEDVLRFETVRALGAAGVDPNRLAIEVPASELVRGKLDLVLDPPRGTVVEFKFPRDSRTGISPDTMTLGELLRDFQRVAMVPAEDRWVVQLINHRLRDYLLRTRLRYPLTWATQLGEELVITSATMAALPATAGGSYRGADALWVRARCEAAIAVGAGLSLYGYRVEIDPAPVTV